MSHRERDESGRFLPRRESDEGGSTAAPASAPPPTGAELSREELVERHGLHREVMADQSVQIEDLQDAVDGLQQQLEASAQRLEETLQPRQVALVGQQEGGPRLPAGFSFPSGEITADDDEEYQFRMAPRGGDAPMASLMRKLQSLGIGSPSEGLSLTPMPHASSVPPSESDFQTARTAPPSSATGVQHTPDTLQVSRAVRLHVEEISSGSDEQYDGQLAPKSATPPSPSVREWGGRLPARDEQRYEGGTSHARSPSPLKRLQDSMPDDIPRNVSSRPSPGMHRADAATHEQVHRLLEELQQSRAAYERLKSQQYQERTPALSVVSAAQPSRHVLTTNVDMKAVPKFTGQQGLIVWNKFKLGCQECWVINAHKVEGDIQAQWNMVLSSCSSDRAHHFLKSVIAEILEYCPQAEYLLVKATYGGSAMELALMYTNQSGDTHFIAGQDKRSALFMTPQSDLGESHLNMPAHVLASLQAAMPGRGDAPKVQLPLFWAFVVVAEVHMCRPLPSELDIWSTQMKMCLKNPLDPQVTADETPQDFLARCTNTHSLFTKHAPNTFADGSQDPLSVFLLGLPPNLQSAAHESLRHVGVLNTNRADQLKAVYKGVNSQFQYLNAQASGRLPGAVAKPHAQFMTPTSGALVPSVQPPSTRMNRWHRSVNAAAAALVAVQGESVSTVQAAVGNVVNPTPGDNVLHPPRGGGGRGIGRGTEQPGAPGPGRGLGPQTPRNRVYCWVCDRYDDHHPSHCPLRQACLEDAKVGKQIREDKARAAMQAAKAGRQPPPPTGGAGPQAAAHASVVRVESEPRTRFGPNAACSSLAGLSQEIKWRETPTASALMATASAKPMAKGTALGALPVPPTNGTALGASPANGTALGASLIPPTNGTALGASHVPPANGTALGASSVLPFLDLSWLESEPPASWDMLESELPHQVHEHITAAVERLQALCDSAASLKDQVFQVQAGLSVVKEHYVKEAKKAFPVSFAPARLGDSEAAELGSGTIPGYSIERDTSCTSAPSSVLAPIGIEPIAAVLFPVGETHLQQPLEEIPGDKVAKPQSLRHVARPVSFVSVEPFPDSHLFASRRLTSIDSNDAPFANLAASGTVEPAASDLILQYLKANPSELTYFANPASEPSRCVGIMVQGVKHVLPSMMLDGGANICIFDEDVATSLGVTIHPTQLRLTTSNEVSTPVLGITGPLILSCGDDPRLQTEHCFLVVKRHPGACYRVLIGNSDSKRFGAVHDTGTHTYTLRPEWFSLGVHSSLVAFPVECRRP